MSENKRLLTDEEWRKAWQEGRYNGGGDIGSNQAILKAQDVKTLKEVGEWLFEHSTAQEVDFPPKIISFTMSYNDWQALKQGKLVG